MTQLHILGGGAAAGLVITVLWVRWFPSLWDRKRIDESVLPGD